MRDGQEMIKNKQGQKDTRTDIEDWNTYSNLSNINSNNNIITILISS